VLNEQRGEIEAVEAEDRPGAFGVFAGLMEWPNGMRKPNLAPACKNHMRVTEPGGMPHCGGSDDHPGKVFCGTAGWL